MESRKAGLPREGTWAKIAKPPWGTGKADPRHRELYRHRATWLIVRYEPRNSWDPYGKIEPVLLRRGDGLPFLPDDDLSDKITYEERVPLKWIVPLSPLEMLAAQAED